MLDAFKGDHSNFVRDDELDASWRIFTPLLRYLDEHKEMYILFLISDLFLARDGCILIVVENQIPTLTDLVDQRYLMNSQGVSDLFEVYT